MLSALSLDCGLIVGVSLLGGMLAPRHRLQSYASPGLPQLLRGQHAGGGILSHAAGSSPDGFAAYRALDGPGTAGAVLPGAVLLVSSPRAAKTLGMAAQDEHSRKAQASMTHHHQPCRDHRDDPSLRYYSWENRRVRVGDHSLVGGVALASRDHGRLCRKPGRRSHGMGRFPRDDRPQTRRCADHRQLDVGLGRFQTSGPPGQCRVRADDPSGRRAVCHRTGTTQSRCSLRLDGRGARLLGRHLSLVSP